MAVTRCDGPVSYTHLDQLRGVADAVELARPVACRLSMRADVQLLGPGALANDGKVIEDKRSYA